MIDLMFLYLFIRWSYKKNKYTCNLSKDIRILVDNQEYPKNPCKKNMKITLKKSEILIKPFNIMFISKCF